MVSSQADCGRLPSLGRQGIGRVSPSVARAPVRPWSSKGGQSSLDFATRGVTICSVKSLLNDRASRQSATGGEQRRGQSALYRRQRRRRLYAQNAARASWEFRGSHGRGRRERVRGGGGRAA